MFCISRSIVLASLHYTSNSVVDVDQIQRRLSGNHSAAAIATEQTTAQVVYKMHFITK